MKSPSIRIGMMRPPLRERSGDPAPDQVPTRPDSASHSRLFLIQRHEGRVYLPRSPSVAAGLTGEERQGTWHLIRADYPSDATTYARAVVAGQCSSEDGPCAHCAAETVGTGTWQEMIDLAASTGLTITPRRPQDVMVPSMTTWPRYFEIADGG
jgi:hypothetical protein